MDSRTSLTSTRKSSTGNKRWILVVLLAVTVSCGVGVLIGWFSRRPTSTDCCDGPCLGVDVPGKIIEDGEAGITQKIIDAIDGARIKSYLK